METLAILMFGILLLCLLIGYPVAFTLGGVSVILGMLTFGFGFFTLLPMRIWDRMTNFTLVAVPLFIFMGVLLERSGIAEELLETMSLLFRRLGGGLAISVVLVGAVLAATTGIIAATVVTMGIISLPVMIRKGYSPELATGTICAAGTLCQIIPPSIALVILGDIMGISVGELFAGALLPGVLLCFLYLVWIIAYAFARPHAAGSSSQAEGDFVTRKELSLRVVKALMPALFLIVAVLGTIFFGIASPTESAGMGALGAIILTIIKRRMSLDVLKYVVVSTTRLCSMAFMILLGAAAFGLVFRGLGGDSVVKDFLVKTIGGRWGILAIVMFTLFFLGFFLDFIEITFIVIPILAPIIKEIGFDPLWFSILVAVNFQTSFLTPPFGFALFFLRGVAPPEVTTDQIYRGAVPFIFVQMIALLLVIIFPQLATWLPSILFK
jgi:tripartite ATP-independent transporter DctM subunit